MYATNTMRNVNNTLHTHNKPKIINIQNMCNKKIQTHTSSQNTYKHTNTIKERKKGKF
jgi:hypothetical protein